MHAYIPRMPQHPLFLPPSLPVAARALPMTDRHQIAQHKADGFRLQIHIAPGSVHLFSKNGHDLSRRFRRILPALRALPVTSAVLDAELVACRADGYPDFDALMRDPHAHLCCWCFDLLALDGTDHRAAPLRERLRRLRKLIERAGLPALLFSEPFANPAKLLAASEALCLEGIVIKDLRDPYQPGRNPHWLKLKTRAWREANRDRWKRFRAPT